MTRNATPQFETMEVVPSALIRGWVLRTTDSNARDGFVTTILFPRHRDSCTCADARLVEDSLRDLFCHRGQLSHRLSKVPSA